MKLQKEIEIEIPSIPNFILVKGGEKISIAELSEKELQQIADAWKAKLIKRSHEIRNEGIPHTI